MNETKQKGLITEIQCELAFSKLGILLSRPIVEDSRYDYLADLEGKIIRIQCKTCSVAEDESYIEFATRSCRTNSEGTYTRNYSKLEIDYFYTFYKNQSYLVPVEECSTSKKLHFGLSTKNGQIKNISFAKDFELSKILQERENFNSFQNWQINILTKIKQADKETNFCIICGKPISKKATRCVDCYNQQQQITQRPSREELKRLIREKPFLQIGKDYNVSDNTIRKWCDSYNLPRKKMQINKITEEEWKGI